MIRLFSKILKFFHFYKLSHQIRDNSYKKVIDRVGKFNKEEIYSLDLTIATFLIPRLKALREAGSIPMNLNEEEWKDILDKIISGFEVVYKEDFGTLEDWNYANSEEGRKQVKKSLELFSKYYFDLWY